MRVIGADFNSLRQLPHVTMLVVVTNRWRLTGSFELLDIRSWLPCPPIALCRYVSGH